MPLVLAGTAPVSAGDAGPGIYAPGDPIVTGFSGVVPPAAPPPSGDPMDATFIDLDGASMLIQQLQPNGPPQGQLIPSPPVFTAKARDVGQVFGITLDDAVVPNIYLSATSAFGLDLVVPDASGNPARSKVGAPAATFMAGQWGTAGGTTGFPGSIWKVDGTTGQISLFTTIAANSGAGLGDIVFDPSTEQFFASDLDTGIIYRLDLTGAILDTFDHGVNGRPNHGLAAVPDDGSEMDITNPAFNSEDPATWGYTQPERKVYGLAMHGGRLYYAVAEGPQVWSVGINLDGSFADDARWELDVSGLPSTNEVTNIVFDNQGRMTLAQRGPQVGSYDYTVFAAPKTSSVVRYTQEVPDDPTTPSTWIETPDTYAIGFRPDGQNASGGIALGYGFDPGTQTIGGACYNYLWSTGDSLRDNPALSPPLDPPAQVHGLQGNDHNLVRPQNDPPFSSYFTDYDGVTDDSQAQYQGHVGDVEIWQKCEGAPGYGYTPPYFPPPGYIPPPDGNLTLTKSAWPKVCLAGNGDWFCGFTIRVKNTGPTVYWGPVTVDDWLPANNPGATMSFAPQPPWSCGQIGSTEYECAYPPVVLYPGDSIDLHETVTLPMQGNTYCYLDNAAGIEWLYGYHDANPADDYDFASALIPDPNCQPPQGPKTNLKLEKVAKPQQCLQGGGGWDCVFYIKVTNTGPGDYNAPIQVQDTLPFATPTSYAPSPPWNCAPSGAVLTCDHPAQLLHPGQFVWLRITATIPYALAKSKQICKIDNTAQITEAPGGTDLNTNPADDQDGATAIIPSDDCNPNPPKTDLSITKDAIGCVQHNAIGGPGEFVCAYKVTVKDEGPGNFNGSIVVHDVFAPAILPASLLTAPPGICVPSGGGYDCTLSGVSLIPGQTTFFYIGFHLPSDTKICDVKNGAHIKSPAGGSPLNFNPANDNAGASVHIPSPNCDQNPGGTDLSLTKTAAPCVLKILLPVGAGVACFDVTIKNEGPGNFNGPIHFLDHPTPTASGVSGTPNLACLPSGSDFDCASTGSVALLAGASTTYNVSVFIDTQQGQVCEVTNRAKITSPVGGSAQNSNAANDSGGGTAPVIGGGCNPTKTDLSLTKSSADCGRVLVQLGTSAVCFDVTIKNEGPGNFNGPIHFSDQMTPAGGLNASGGASCSPSGTGSDCASSGNVPLPSGQSVTYHLTGFVKNSDGQVCKVDNTAQITSPAGGSTVNSNPGNDTGSATDTLQGANCGPARILPTICPLSRRAPISSDNPTGCCPAGTNWNGRICATPGQHKPPIRLCPVGTTGIYPNCVTPTKPTCREGQKGIYPNCYTPTKPVCRDGMIGTYPNCHFPPKLCTDGLVGTYPDCHPPRQLTCENGMVGTYPNCHVPPIRVCRDGLVGTYPDCHSPVTPTCRSNQTGVYPDCVDIVKVCPKGSIGRYPNCLCPRGTHGKPPRCVPNNDNNNNDNNGPVLEIPKQINPGLQIVPICPRGTIGKYPNCVPLGGVILNNDAPAGAININ